MDYNVEQIAQQFHVTSSVIADFCNSNGIRNVGKKSKLSKECYDKIVNLYRQKHLLVQPTVTEFGENAILTNLTYDIANEKHLNSIQNILTQYRRNCGYEIMWCDFVVLQFDRYSVAGNEFQAQTFNIVEKAILSAIDEAMLSPCSVEKIADFYELNQLIVKYYVDEFIDDGMLDKAKNDLVFTDNGKTNYKAGHRINKGKPLNKTFCYDYDDKIVRCNASSLSVEDQQLYRTIKIKCPKLTNINVIDELCNCKILNKNNAYKDITLQNLSPAQKLCCICYFYDFEQEQSIIVPYDIEDGELEVNLPWLNTHTDYSSYVCENQQYKERLEIIKTISIDKRYYQEQRDNQDSAKNEVGHMILYGSTATYDKFLEFFKTAEESIIIQCPWIRDEAIDKVLIDAIQSAIDRGVFVFIQYGINTNIDREESDKEAINKLSSMRDKAGIRRVFVIWTGNSHIKEVIVDQAYVMSGSHNFLSFNPYSRSKENPASRQEAMALIHDKDLARNSIENYINNFLDSYLATKTANNLYYICALYAITSSQKILDALISCAKDRTYNDCEVLSDCIVGYNLINYDNNKLTISVIKKIPEYKKPKQTQIVRNFLEYATKSDKDCADLITSLLINFDDENELPF